MTIFNVPGQLGWNQWVYTPIFYSNGYTGTNGNDTAVLGSDDTGTISMLAGHDHVTVDGSGSYLIDLGQGNDRLVIDSATTVFADGGTGFDVFDMRMIGNFDVDGGAQIDSLTFSNLAGSGIFVEHTVDGQGSVRTWIDGQAGDETIGFSDVEKIFGSAQRDYLGMSDNDDWASAGDGNDVMYGRAGDDYFLAGDGDDTAFLGLDDDTYYGGDGDDYGDGGAGNDLMFGNDGDDILRDGKGDDRIYGGAGNDSIDVRGGHDRAYGGAGDDIVYVVQPDVDESDEGDFYDGGSNEAGQGSGPWGDTLSYVYTSGGVSIDTNAQTARSLSPGTHDFGLDSFNNFESYIGSHNRDVFFSKQNTSQYFNGNGGDDIIVASLGAHTFDGDDGYDEVDYGRLLNPVFVDLEAGEATIKLTPNGLVLTTQTLQNIEAVVGSTKQDVIAGDDQNNVIEGKQGNDQLIGKGGADFFVFNGDDGPLGYDTILDFDRGSDRLMLQNMETTNYVDVTGFDALDTNGDGQVSIDDQSFFVWQDTGYLMLHGSIVQMDGVTSLDASDFLIL